MTTQCKCPNCGADIEIPAKILHDAERWQHRMKQEAERKAGIRKKNKSYCQIKKKEAN
jgi:hypothetical protein